VNKFLKPYRPKDPVWARRMVREDPYYEDVTQEQFNQLDPRDIDEHDPRFADSWKDWLNEEGQLVYWDGCVVPKSDIEKYKESLRQQAYYNALPKLMNLPWEEAHPLDKDPGIAQHKIRTYWYYWKRMQNERVRENVMNGRKPHKNITIPEVVDYLVDEVMDLLEICMLRAKGIPVPRKYDMASEDMQVQMINLVKPLIQSSQETRAINATTVNDVVQLLKKGKVNIHEAKDLMKLIQMKADMEEENF